MENIKSYAYDNSKIGNGWEGWKDKYAEFLEKNVFGDRKIRCNRIYSDPDEGNMKYYTQICIFLNSQEQEIIKAGNRYHYCVGNYGGKARINVCKDRKFLFCLKTDQFGFSAPTYKNKDTHPYGVYYKGADDKAIAIANIVKWVYITRTIGGSFLWPEEEKYSQPPYNNDRGGSLHPQRSSYINDRVDLTLLEIKHFYDVKKELEDKEQEYDIKTFIVEYQKTRPGDVLGGSLGKSPNLYEWLMHFDCFKTYIDYFELNMFIKQDEVIDITGSDCLVEVDINTQKESFWNKDFNQVFVLLCGKIEERTNIINTIVQEWIQNIDKE